MGHISLFERMRIISLFNQLEIGCRNKYKVVSDLVICARREGESGGRACLGGRPTGFFCVCVVDEDCGFILNLNYKKF